MTSPNPREEGQAVERYSLTDHSTGGYCEMECDPDGGYVTYADFASMRARAERAENNWADWKEAHNSVVERWEAAIARAERAEEDLRLMTDKFTTERECAVRFLQQKDAEWVRAEQAERERDEAIRQRNEAREQIVWGRYTDREYRDRGSPTGWTWLPHVRMWARLDQDHSDAIQRAESAERELAEAKADYEEMTKTAAEIQGGLAEARKALRERDRILWVLASKATARSLAVYDVDLADAPEDAQLVVESSHIASGIVIKAATEQ